MRGLGTLFFMSKFLYVVDEDNQILYIESKYITLTYRKPLLPLHLMKKCDLR